MLHSGVLPREAQNGSRNNSCPRNHLLSPLSSRLCSRPKNLNISRLSFPRQTPPQLQADNITRSLYHSSSAPNNFPSSVGASLLTQSPRRFALGQRAPPEVCPDDWSCERYSFSFSPLASFLVFSLASFLATLQPRILFVL